MQAAPAIPMPPRRRPNTDPRLAAIRAKVEAGERLTLADGEVLFGTGDVWGVCELADGVRRRRHGDAAYYNVNRHMNYSNVCALSCKFCDFYAKPGDEHAYTRDLAYIREQAAAAVESGATEMHIVGGLHPTLPFSYYTDMLAAIREESGKAAARQSSNGQRPGAGCHPSSFILHPSSQPTLLPGRLHIKAFTAVEIVHLAKIARVYKGASLGGEEGRAARVAGIRWVLERLVEAGLGSLPGGGAEVFDDRVHDEAYKGKIRSDVWLDVHRTAHEMGLNTNATILYGHIESVRDRLVHMDMLRAAQDEALARIESSKAAQQQSSQEDSVPPSPHPLIPSSPSPLAASRADRADALPHGRAACTPAAGCFQTIIPLPFCPDGSELERLPGPAGLENLRMLAVCRLMLDNFAHVKAFWIMQTLPMAQLMLTSGADDMDGTVVWYDITKVGGAGTHQEVSVWTLQKAIREAGFVPVERDTLYRRVVRQGKDWGVVPV